MTRPDYDPMLHVPRDARPWLEPAPTAPTARDRILSALDLLGTDEAEVLALVAERLAAGRRAYGELRPLEDPRRFEREALEEAADGLVYVAAGLVRVRRLREQAATAETMPPRPASAPEGRLVGAERGR